MKKTILTMLGIVALAGCSYQASTDMGQTIYNENYRSCIHSRSVVDSFRTYKEMDKYCGCRAYYISQNVTFEEHRDMVVAEFQTGLTKVSARVMNEAEKYCNKQ
ncbi:MAG: hypothetical protein FWE50_04055 [Alphaproteobacteria bacterium]|nr:hypothetical protein [Alphaproteobacteria bacterium]